MTVLSRYLFREFLRAAAACILGFLLLFLLIDFVDHAEDLLRHNADLGEIGWYYLTRVPGIFVLISPVGTMLAVLVAVSLRVRSNELTAIFSSGVSLLRFCMPILVGCALVSALSLLCSEVLAPAANRHAREIERLRVRPGKVAAQFSGNRYWMRGERGMRLAPEAVNAWRAAWAAGQAPRRSKIFMAVICPSLSPSERARACSYGQLSFAHSAAPWRQSPAICSA